ncbi:SOS response-associated peptidase [Saccharicrinis sp. FJH54]|uniref:SOS response-associated peptidase n=1 Tax=Saccharicrinis sp. FJH54 TaxID=3344665 RepID=UPI0035D4124C
MCFHFSLVANVKTISKRFGVSGDFIKDYTPQIHFNGFSHPETPVILNQGEPTAIMANWGLIPEWVRTMENAEKMRNNTLNARTETIFEKPSFKTAIRNHRCLIPATGFFEWKLLEKKKYPHLIYVKGQDIFAFAGIYSEWGTDMGNKSFHTFSILTKAANDLMADIHNTQKRMPVILSPGNERLWVNPKLNHREIVEILESEKNENLDFRTISHDFMHSTGPAEEVLKVYHYPELDNNLLF